MTGLEPGTGFPYNRKVERRAGRVPRLSPGETRRFSLEFGLHSGTDAVKEVAGRIADIQEGHEPRVRTKPPAIAH